MQERLLSALIFSSVGLSALGVTSRIQLESLKFNSNTPVVAVDSEADSEPKVLAANVQAPKPVATPAPVIVEVASGDTLTSIATTHNTIYTRLFEANTQIANPNLINPGDKIRVPLAEEVLAPRELPTPPPVVTATAAVAPQRQYASAAPAVADGSVWDQLARCESGGNWAINTGNGYYGGLQFSLATWRGVGGSGLPSENSREEQIARAEILLARSGWGQWPACTSKLGLR